MNAQFGLLCEIRRSKLQKLSRRSRNLGAESVSANATATPPTHRARSRGFRHVAALILAFTFVHPHAFREYSKSSVHDILTSTVARSTSYTSSYTFNQLLPAMSTPRPTVDRSASEISVCTLSLNLNPVLITASPSIQAPTHQANWRPSSTICSTNSAPNSHPSAASC